MQIVIVNFSLDGMAEQDYEQLAASVADAFADVPGLVSKVWLADRSEGVYGGVYTFRSADPWLRHDLIPSLGPLDDRAVDEMLAGWSRRGHGMRRATRCPPDSAPSCTGACLRTTPARDRALHKALRGST